MYALKICRATIETTLLRELCQQFFQTFMLLRGLVVNQAYFFLSRMKAVKILVGRAGIELATPGFSAPSFRVHKATEMLDLQSCLSE